MRASRARRAAATLLWALWLPAVGAGGADELYQRALRAFEKGEAALALDLSTRAVEADPQLVDAHALRGVTLEQAGRSDEALAAYREALRLDPGRGEVQRNLTLLLLQRQDYAAALEAGRRALELEPRHPDALNNLAVAALKLSRFDEAERALRSCLEIDPASTSAHYNLALVHAERRRVAEAIGELEIAYQGAHETRDQYRREWIAEVCTRLLNRYPGDGALWRAHRLLGRLYFDQGWYGSAIPHLREAAERRDFYSQLHLGISYKNKALAPEARDALERAVRLDPQSPQARNELGHVLGTLYEEWGEAERCFRASLERRAESPEVRYNLAYALFQQARYDEARVEFREAFRLKPEMEHSEHYRGLKFPE